jgi:hypothetical protein
MLVIIQFQIVGVVGWFRDKKNSRSFSHSLHSLITIRGAQLSFWITVEQ